MSYHDADTPEDLPTIPDDAEVMTKDQVCDRCGRELRDWPIQRGNRCSPKAWVYCIRQDGKR